MGLTKLLKESSDTYKYLDDDRVLEMVSTISSLIQWDVKAARSFCLRLLEDVNDHTMMSKIDELFYKQEGE